MIKELFKLNFKDNKVWLFGIIGMTLIYVTISVAMFDPDQATTMEALISLLPDAMVKMFGFENLGTNMTYYISNYLYGFILLIFPMIYIIVTSNKLVSKHVDRGSMIYLITMPYTRRKIIFNQAIFLALSVAFIYIVDVLVVIIMSAIMFPGHLDIGAFLMLNFITVGVQILLASISFVLSCSISESGRVVGTSSGILILSAVLHMINGIDEKVEFLKFFTPFSFVDVEIILSGTPGVFLTGILLYAVASLLFYLAIWIFDKKSLII